jgi:hypothetical protein
MEYMMKRMFCAAVVAATTVASTASFAGCGISGYSPCGYGNGYDQNRGYTIQTPGQFPTYVRPDGMGGYTAQTPGEFPTYIHPNGNGGYVVQKPGEFPTYVNPN